jgi:hypothetical protein
MEGKVTAWCLFQPGVNGVVMESFGEILKFFEQAGCGEGPVGFAVGWSSLKTEICGEESHGILEQEKVMGGGGDQGMSGLGVGGDEENVRGAIFGACRFPLVQGRGGSVRGEEESNPHVAAMQKKAKVKTGPGAAEEFDFVKGELEMAVFGVVVNGAALESAGFQGELTVEGFGLFPALEEVLGFLVRVVDFEE